VNDASNEYDFWPRAHRALTAARAELDSNDDTRLPYAALQLRMAMEVLTYERAHTLRDLLPTELIDAWQPPKVLKALLEVDRAADHGASLWVGIEETPGVPAKDMQFVGAEHVLSFKTIDKHYAALGSYLHMPTLKQFREDAAPKSERLRQRCEEIAAEVNKALSSSLRNFVAGASFTFECLKCKAEVKRRFPMKAFDFTVACLSCGGEYRAVSEDGREIKFYPLTMKVPCQGDGCDGVKLLWRHEAKSGTEWVCDKCHRGYALGLTTFERSPAKEGRNDQA